MLLSPGLIGRNVKSCIDRANRSRSICSMDEHAAAQRSSLVRESLGSDVSASVLLTDEADRVLLVKSVSGVYWTIPSAIAREDEAPHDRAERLMAEQLGVTALAGRLLVIGWSPATKDHSRAVVNFLFEGGMIHNEESLVKDLSELTDARFFTWEQVEGVVSAVLAEWLEAARQAREDSVPAYLPTVA